VVKTTAKIRSLFEKEPASLWTFGNTPTGQERMLKLENGKQVKKEDEDVRDKPLCYVYCILGV